MSDQRAAKCPQYTASFAACCGALACGTFLGWSNPAQPKRDEYSFEITDDDFTWVGSIFALGAATVCIPIGFLINIFGRKWTMLGLVVPFLVSWAMIIWPVNIGVLIAGRFIGGVAGGAFCVAAPIYTAEISESTIRGTTGFLFQLNITIGILLVYLLGGFCTIMVYSLLCALIPIGFAIFFFFMPESPFFLLHKGKLNAARDGMQFFRGKKYAIDSEISDIQTFLANNPIEVNSFKHIDSFNRRTTIRGFLICCGLMFFQQFCGINVVIFFSTEIFGEASSDIDKFLSTIIIGVVQVIATFISTMIVDKVGRRILLMLSDFIMAICHIVLGVYFYYDENHPEAIENVGWLPVLCVCLFIIMFSFGFGPIPWLMVGELFAPDVKGLCGSLGGALNWLLAFAVTSLFKTLQVSIGNDGTFWFFAACSLVGTAFVFFFVPETKNITLAEIQEKLDK